MKTIIVKTCGDLHQLNETVHKIEKCADKNIDGAVVCTQYLSRDNYNTIHGMIKDAVAMDDYDLFIVACTDAGMTDLTSLQSLNKAHTLVCTADEVDSAKNFVIML